MEQTYIMIKPDGVQRGLVGEIIGRFEKRGYKLVALKLVQPSVEHLEKHYEDLSSKGFFKGLIKYMASGQSSRARARGGARLDILPSLLLLLQGSQSRPCTDTPCLTRQAPLSPWCGLLSGDLNRRRLRSAPPPW